jgi:plasmid stability protein
VPSITLKNLPKALHRELKSRAQMHRRSLNSEVIATLEAATSSTRPADIEAMSRDAQAARKKFKRAIKAREIDAWKNRGRL